MSQHSSNTELKEKLHRIIDNGDDQLLNELSHAVEQFNAAKEPYITLSDQDLNELSARTKRRLSGASSLYSWEEAKAIITKVK